MDRLFHPKRIYLVFILIVIALLTSIALLWLCRVSYFYHYSVQEILNILINLLIFCSILLIIYLFILSIKLFRQRKIPNTILALVMVLLSLLLLLKFYDDTNNYTTSTLITPTVIQKDVENSIIIVKPKNSNEEIYLRCTDIEVNLIEVNKEYGSIVYDYFSHDETQGYLRYLFD